MNRQQVLSVIDSRYPGSKVIELPAGEPKEIIVELEEREDFSRAVAVIERSEPHFHRQMTEEYTIMEGTLQLHVDDREIRLEKGQKYTILPGVVHWAEGEPAWVQVDCYPAWSADDHILVE